MQITLTQRAFKGLNFVASYTWANAIDMSTSNRGSTWENAYDPTLERGPSSQDVRHRFTLGLTYTSPRAAKYNALLGEWQLSSIVILESARPLDYYDSSNYFSGTGSGNDRWNIYGDPANLKPSLAGFPFVPAGIDDNGNQYGDPQCLAIANAQGSLDTLNYAGGCFIQNGTILIPPAYGQFGNMRRNSVRGYPFTNWDMSVNKMLKLSEHFNLQLRFEVFNVLNHPNFAGVTTDLSNGGNAGVGAPQYTPDVAASNPAMGSGGSRHIQLGAKLIW